MFAREMVGMARYGRLSGTRIGGGPAGERDRGLSSERIRVDYYCSRGHRCRPSFAIQAVIPELWDCAHCGQPAGRDADKPPTATAPPPYKTHLAYVRERRTEADAERLLNEALDRLRGSG
jgi:hypothetical protein